MATHSSFRGVNGNSGPFEINYMDLNLEIILPYNILSNRPTDFALHLHHTSMHRDLQLQFLHDLPSFSLIYLITMIDNYIEELN